MSRFLIVFPVNTFIPPVYTLGGASKGTRGSFGSLSLAPTGGRVRKRLTLRTNIAAASPLSMADNSFGAHAIPSLDYPQIRGLLIFSIVVCKAHTIQAIILQLRYKFLHFRQLKTSCQLTSERNVLSLVFKSATSWCSKPKRFFLRGRAGCTNNRRDQNLHTG